MASKPVVAHLMRHYLSPTETFIGNQICSLESFKPIVMCHERDHDCPFSTSEVFCTMDLLKEPSRTISNFSYKLIRHLTKKEANLFCDIAIEYNVKLLHFHYAVDTRYFLNFKKRLALPSIVSLYGYDVSSFPKLYFGYGRKYLAPIWTYFDKFLAMSEDMKNDLIKIGCPEDKILVHYYGIETEKFLCPRRRYNDKEVLNILMCGTLEAKKAQRLALRALKKLETRGNTNRKFRMTIVGDGPMRSQLEKMVKNFNWREKVFFTGHIPYRGDRLVREYHKADIFVLPSITAKGEKEGIPGTVVEAMASGLPVVSTYHAGIPEVIENLKHGILVKEKDVDGLAEAVKALIENSNLREKLGRAAAERASREFNVKKRIENLEKIYQSLL